MGIALVSFFGTALLAEDKISIRVDLIWAAPSVRSAVVALKEPEDPIKAGDDLQIIRLRTDAGIREKVQRARHNGTIVSIASKTLVTIPDRTATFSIGGKARPPHVPATVLLKERKPIGPVGPPTPGQPTRLPHRTLRDFGIKLSLKPHKGADGDLFVELDAAVNGVDFDRTSQRGNREMPMLTFRELSGVIQVESEQTAIVAGLFTAEDLAFLRHAPRVANTAVFQRVDALRQQRPQGRLLLLVTPRLIPDASQGENQ